MNTKAIAARTRPLTNLEAAFLVGLQPVTCLPADNARASTAQLQAIAMLRNMVDAGLVSRRIEDRSGGLLRMATHLTPDGIAALTAWQSVKHQRTA